MFVNQVLDLTNVERTKAGLKPLKLNSQLVDAAQDHSNDMAEDDFFSHTGIDDSDVGNRATDSGYQYSTVGENIAAGQTTAEEVVEGWMNSPDHRANILNPNYTEIGIGYEHAAEDTGAVNYNYYWTQVFGTPLAGANFGTENLPEDYARQGTEDSGKEPEMSDNGELFGNNDTMLTGDRDAVDFSEDNAEATNFKPNASGNWYSFSDILNDFVVGGTGIDINRESDFAKQSGKADREQNSEFVDDVYIRHLLSDSETFNTSIWLMAQEN